MEVASIPAGMDAYEDMFKEIIRKLHGDETVATATDFDYSATYSVSLTTAVAGNPSVNGNSTHMPQENDTWFTNPDTLEWTASKIASYNPVQKVFRCADCESCGFLARVAEHWLGTHANLRVFQCTQCAYSSAWARCVRMHLARQHNAPEQNTLWKESPVLGEVTKYLSHLKARVESDEPGAQGRSVRSGVSSSGDSPTGSSPTGVSPPEPRDPAATGVPAPGKRYSCSSCPYTTDRRDLYTRHEAIHREEKPFHCYVCQKQFNRADHVKKHFLRMHRDHPYDLNRIRRNVSAPSSKNMNYYGKFDSQNNQGQNDGVNSMIAHSGMHHMTLPSNQINPQNTHSLNIPSANFPSINNRLTQNNSQEVKPTNQLSGMNSIIDTTKMGDKPEIAKTKSGKEKRYSCCYCHWSGVDNWCLKRHLNTHLKPFVCTLCDYKAARSERLATHVLKVHNKKTCSRCNFIADDATQLTIHLQQHHGQLPAHPPEPAPNTERNPRRALKRGTWGAPVGIVTDGTYQGGTNYSQPLLHQPILQPMQQVQPRRNVWRKKPNGADRLFSYMEASDSEEDESMMEVGEDCQHCGCHFVDNLALQTHMVTHHRMGQAPGTPYRCSMCGYNSASQSDIVAHMQRHTAIDLRCPEPSCRYVTQHQGAMEEHTRLAHPPLPPLEQKCPHCGFIVLSGVALSRHAKAHHVASAECSGCNRIHARFERHRNGETWAISDDEEVPEEQNTDKEAERKAALQQMRLLRAKSRAYKRRYWRARAARALARKKLRKRKRNNVRKTSKPVNIVRKLRRKYRRTLLFRRRYSCYMCHMTRRNLVAIHSSGSLALHRLWRHGHERYPCDSCDLRFRRRYQVLLHATREHARCPSVASINAAIVEPIVTLTVPQVALAPQETVQPLQPPACQKIQPLPQPVQQHHHQIQPQHLQPQQYGAHAQLQTHMTLSNGGYHTTIPQETYSYSQAAPTTIAPPLPQPQQQPQQQQQQQHFHSSMYNMVPKQMWYPQLPAPSYYIPAPFPPS